jgi:hypothetical protein
MRALLTTLVILAVPAHPVAAAQESEEFSAKIEPGKGETATASCDSGRMLSGGYKLDTVFVEGGNYEKLVVLLNGPVGDNAWGLTFLNSGTVPISIDYRIMLLCE